MNLFLFLAGVLLFTLWGGSFLEKIKIPGIFSALILGLILALKNPFVFFTTSEVFKFLAWLGMYFLLFLIGFELDWEKIKKLGWFIIKATFFIILFEAIFGSLLVYFVFGSPWFLAVLVALSFATVGEAVLIPILDEFSLTQTFLGQTILGVGTLDDIIEVLVVVGATLFTLGRFKGGEVWNEVGKGLGVLLVLFFTVLVLVKAKVRFLKRTKKASFLFLFALAFLFLLVGVGSWSEMAVLGALLAGIGVKNFLTPTQIALLRVPLKVVTYGFLAPFFFLWVGMDTQMNYLFSSFWLVFLVIGVTYGAKILASFLVAKSRLGKKPSIFMGISLGVRFSTSIVIIKFLFERSLMGRELYSVLIASTVAFKFIVPFLLSFLVRSWSSDLFPKQEDTNKSDDETNK